jgi:hypothetical protein
VPVRTEVSVFPLTAANEALEQLRAGFLDGAIALSVHSGKQVEGSLKLPKSRSKPRGLARCGSTWDT